MVDEEKTWGEFLNYLLDDKKVKDRPENLRVYRSRFRKLLSFFQDKEFNRKNFTAFITEMRENGYSPAYRNCLIKMGKNYFKFIGLTEEIKDYTYYDEEPEDDIEVLTPEEVKKIATYEYPYQHLKEYRNLRDYVAIMFLYDTASRIQDLENVLWANIFATPIPYVKFKKKDTKSNKKSYIPLTKDMYALLNKLPRNGPRVFDSITGKKFSRTAFRERLKERAKACGITLNVHPHLFRHTKISHLLTVYKLPLAEVTKLARHSDPKITMRYMHPELIELLPLVYASPFIKREDAIVQIPNLVIDYMKKVYGMILGMVCSISFEQVSDNIFNYRVQLDSTLGGHVQMIK